MNEKTIFLAGNFLSVAVGVRSVHEDLFDHLLQQGWKVHFASKYSNKLIRMFDFLLTAWRYRKKYHLAVIEVYSGQAFIWADVLGRYLSLIRKPYILTLHGGKLPIFAKKNPVKFQRLITSASIVTTPSKYLFNTFRHMREGIKYIPNGISTANYKFWVRKNPVPDLIWLRAFHSIYSPSQAVEVLYLILKHYPCAHLTMIGPDKHDGTYVNVMERVRELRLEDRVTFTGAIPKTDVANHLARGDIFLNTTNYESFGVSVVEAAACGLCIVSTNVGELPYFWENGENALLVPPNDPEAMAAAVRRILAEPGLAEKLSENARKKAEEFDWSVVLPQWEHLFDSMIGRSI